MCSCEFERQRRKQQAKTQLENFSEEIIKAYMQHAQASTPEEEALHQIQALQSVINKEHKVSRQEAETSITQEILTALALCFKAGREPVALLINGENFELLVSELKAKYMPVPLSKMPPELFGIPILVVPQVKDFYLVDNRSWREQKW